LPTGFTFTSLPLIERGNGRCGTKNVGCMPRTPGCTAAITYGRDA
jgi:hypothetical protein